MAAQIEMEACMVLGSREPSHPVALFQDDGWDTFPHQGMGCGQTGGTGADDYDLSAAQKGRLESLYMPKSNRISKASGE